MNKYRCYYCKETQSSFKNTINHLIDSHEQEEIRFRLFDGTDQIRTKNFKVVPEICREQGRTITINETKDSIHVSKAGVLPKDSPFKKLLKLEGSTDEKHTHDILNDTSPVQNTDYSEDLLGCSDYIQETDSNYEELIAILPKVIETLKDNGKLPEFLAFSRLLSENKFPLDNIAFLLFIDVVRWFSLDDSATCMRYSDEVKTFWRTGLRLFHGRFLRFMGGPKHKGQIVLEEASPGYFDPQKAKINFIVPDRRVLKDEHKMVEGAAPGIMSKMVENVAASDPDKLQTYKICVDGKKINPCSKGEVNLWGYEEAPTFKDKQNRMETELNHFNDIQAELEKLLKFGHVSTNTLTDSEVQNITEECRRSVTILSERIKDLRRLKLKNQLFLQKLMSKCESDWRKSQYAMVISTIRTNVYLIDNCIDDLLQTNEKLCKQASSNSSLPWLYTEDLAIDLQKQHNMVCLANNESEETDTRLIKQRTPAWQAIREHSIATGSTVNKAIGLEGLKKQKEFILQKSGKMEPPSISEDLQRKFDHGTENEINAVATLVSTVLPAFCPKSCFYEEGCYVESAGDKFLLTVSPDGSLRVDERVVAGIEIKCPYPGKIYSEPVQYEIPHYYVCQILSEMYVLQVDNLFFLSYSKESMVVLNATYDHDLWSDIHREIELLAENDLPKKLSTSLPGIKQRIGEYRKSKVTLVAEVKSKTAIPCKHQSDEGDNCRIHHESPENNKLDSHTGVPISDLIKVFLRCAQLIESCHNLSVKKASEVLVFLLGDLDRIYKPEIPHAYPVAFGFRGYSMKTEVLRKMLQDVLFTLFIKGLYTPVVSYDGQWAKLALQEEDSSPLTILELQRQLYNEVKVKRPLELTEIIFETGVVKVDSYDRLLQEVAVQTDERTGAVTIGPKLGTKLFKTSKTVERLLREQKSKNKVADAQSDQSEASSCSVSADIDAVLSNIPQEILASLDEDTVCVISEINVDDGTSAVASKLDIFDGWNNMYSGDLEAPDREVVTRSDNVVSKESVDEFGDVIMELEIPVVCEPSLVAQNQVVESRAGNAVSNETVDEFDNVVMESEIPIVGETVTIHQNSSNPMFNERDAEKMLLALKTKPKTGTKWVHVDIREFELIMKDSEMINGRLSKQDILSCLNSVRNLDGTSRVRFCKSWLKPKLVSVIYGAFTSQPMEENTRSMSKRRRRKSPETLVNLTRKIIKGFPKSNLNVIIAEHLFPERLEVWRSESPFRSETHIQNVGNIVWFSRPEYNHNTLSYIFACLDVHHLITNCRVKVCKDGFPERGITNKAWISVARENETRLKVSHVEDLIDKQSDSIARLTFSKEVENAMKRIGFENEARFCRLIREFYDAEDEPGISVIQRCQSRIALRNWLLEGVNFSSFPPYGSHIKGIPNIMFQGLLTNIDRRIQLFPYVKSGMYNVRSLGSLEAENFFGEFQDLDPKGTGVIRADEVPAALESACQLLRTRLMPDRPFHMALSEAKVYPLHELMEESDIQEPKDYVYPQFIESIKLK